MAATNTTAVRLTGMAGDVKAIADYHVFPLILESVLYGMFYDVEHDRELQCLNDISALFTVLVVYYCIQYWYARTILRLSGGHD